jgi:putative tryptophan/tyrosine transport system substrate-binding protein
MKRRDFIHLLGSTVAWPIAMRGPAWSQQRTKNSLVGVLVSASPPHPFADALRRGLQALGYSEGRNITLDIRYTEGRSDRAAELARDLVSSRVDVIVAHFTPAVRAAMAATKTIPIVMAPAGAPLQTGFIQSLARPGGNVTGLSAMDAEIGGKRIQLLRELIPNLTCVGVLATTTTTDPYSRPYVADIQAAATAARLKLAPVLIGGPSEFDEGFSIMAKEDAQAVIVQPFFDPYAKVLLQLANKHRIAYMSSGRSTVADGGLVSLAANFVLLYEQAAAYVDKIINGANPSNLPVEQPSKFLVTVNSKTAKFLGLSISPSLLAQIDEMID